MNSLSVARIQYECIFVLAYLLSLTRILNEFINVFANSLSSLWNYFEFTFMYANLSPFLRIHYLLHEFTMDYLFLWIQNRFIIFFVKILWIHYQFRKFTMNSLSFSPIDYVLTILCIESLWIDYLFPRKHYWSVFNVMYS